MLSPAAARRVCSSLRQRGVEAVVLSTCHRTELYWCSAAAGDDGLAESSLRTAAPGPWPDPATSVHHLSGEAVVRHLLRVAAGLESVLLGETEVLGQVRAAAEAARGDDNSAPALGDLFRDAIRFGRRARSETGIGAGALSLASVAVNLVRRDHPDLGERTVLVVGAGSVGLRVVRHLTAERVGRCVLLNRTPATAEAAADRTGVLAAPLAELPRWIMEADAVIVAVRADAFLVTPEMVRGARRGRRTGRLVILDASMPRAVDPAVGRIAGVRAWDLSGLETLVRENRARREAEIPRVEALLEEALAMHRRREQRRLEWSLTTARLPRREESLR